MLKTPLTKLRKAAPGSLTAKDVARHFVRKQYPRTEQSIGDFERGKVLRPAERFFALYAEAIGATIQAVKRAQRATLREKQREDPPRARVASGASGGGAKKNLDAGRVAVA